MTTLYLICSFITLCWLILWLTSKKITWWEGLIVSATCFLIAGITHFCSFKSQTGDKEYWSGQIIGVRQFSAWQEYYEYAVYRTEYYTDTESYTDSKGKRKTRTVRKSRRVFDHWEPTSRWHEKYNVAYSNIGTDYRISDREFQEWGDKFGGISKERGVRTTSEHNSRMIGGNEYDFVSSNRSGFVIPVTKEVSFTNRIKATTSVWSRAIPPAKLDLPEIPVNNNPWVSNRLLGTAKKDFSIRALDDLNGVIGPKIQIDLIIVGFQEDDAMMSNYLESKWRGGTKNQLVITYGPKWARVFGWSKSDICKANIESLFLKNPRNNELLEKVKAELLANYERRDWHDFDHLDIEPGGWAWFWFLFFVIGANGGLGYVFYRNLENKGGNKVEDFVLAQNFSLTDLIPKFFKYDPGSK